MDREYQTYLTEGEHSVIRKWSLNSDLFGEKVSVKRGSVIITGTAMDLDESGRLVLRRDNGHDEVFDSGEITLLIN